MDELKLMIIMKFYIFNTFYLLAHQIFLPDSPAKTRKAADRVCDASINEQENGPQAGSWREERGLDKPQMDNYSLDN